MADEPIPGPMPDTSNGTSRRPLRIANCSGFYGDRVAAAREMLEGGPIDVLTGDWLAELTMLILARNQMRDPSTGYARTFITQMEDVLGTCLERGVKVVSNAGGLNPKGCAEAVQAIADRLGVDCTIAWVDGDDLVGRLPELRETGHDLINMDTGERLEDLGVEPLTANAYLGGWGIREALAEGADVVVTGRVTDAAVIVGPAAWYHGWERTDWDELAGAVVAGHIIECGTQCTGGNYAFFEEVPGIERLGFPIAEVHADGSTVVTKHPGTGGLVSKGTITAQLLYEIQGLEYMNPDATVRLNSIRVDDQGEDRVRVHSVRGLPGPDQVKVAVNYLGGFRNTMTFALTGLDIERKAEVAERTLWSLIPGGRDAFDEVDVRLVRHDRPDPATNDDAMAELRITVMDRDREKVGRAFSNKVVEMALASYPGLFMTTPPTDADAYGVYWPALLPSDVPNHAVHIGGRTIDISPPPTEPPALDRRVPGATPPEPGPGRPRKAPSSASTHPETISTLLEDLSALRINASSPGDASWDDLETTRLPLGTIIGARSGDKGGNANVGLWARDLDGYDWLSWYLTTERFQALLGADLAHLEVDRYELPNLRALNFVVKGILGRGVASTTRSDPQAKGLGEYVRAKHVDIPKVLVPDAD